MGLLNPYDRLRIQELSEEVEELKDKNKQLKAELEAAKARIAELETALDDIDGMGTVECEKMQKRAQEALKDSRQKTKEISDEQEKEKLGAGSDSNNGPSNLD